MRDAAAVDNIELSLEKKKKKKGLQLRLRPSMNSFLKKIQKQTYNSEDSLVR